MSGLTNYVRSTQLSSFTGVVLELETPRKGQASFRRAAETMSRSRSSLASELPGFGMPGTVLPHKGGFRAWLGESRTRLFESTAAYPLQFTEIKSSGHTDDIGSVGVPRWEAQPTLDLGEISGEALGSRPIEQQTFTVFRDPHGSDEERYKAAFHCTFASHAPVPDFWKYKSGMRPTRREWLDAPLFRGERRYLWESTCLGYSADGVHWRQYDLHHPQGVGPAPLRSAADTANAIYYDAGWGGYRLVNRWNVAIRPGAQGTRDDNPSWWRAVRCWRVSSNDRLRRPHAHNANLSDPLAWTETAKACFDRQGEAKRGSRSRKRAS